MAEGAAMAGAKTCIALTTTGVMWQTLIHCVFVASAIGIAWTDRLMASMPQANAAAAEVH
jgi:uncharacterized membrane protein YqhA